MKSEAVALADVRSRSGDFAALAKPRLNLLVVATTAAGYYLGAGRAFDVGAFAATVIGTALVAGGAAAFNQLFERDLDALMIRTRTRPLPDGRLQPLEAAAFATLLSLAGLLLLVSAANALAAALAVATLVSYVLVYTPLKPRTSLATVIGAIPGALPPMIGWAAATGVVSLEAWILFAIVFLWQMPHFLAIAWLCRDDYARAGLPMLPVVEPDGRSTARQATAYAAALVPVSLAPTLIGLTTTTYLVGALVAGALFLVLCVAFARERGPRQARWLFLGSITYLPVILLLLVAARV